MSVSGLSLVTVSEVPVNVLLIVQLMLITACAWLTIYLKKKTLKPILYCINK